MIVTKIMGGLGNQMFQYAVARHLAIKNNTFLKLDISFFDNIGNNTPREYTLGHFNIEENFLTDKELKKIKRNNFHGQSLPQRILRKMFIKLEKKKPISKKAYITEPSPVFTKEVLGIKTEKTVYLYGNWQSEKYFKDIRNVILKDFSLKKEFSGKTKSFLENIEKNNSVSLHIRRGDYVQDKKTNTFHGTCDLNYYDQAIRLIEGKIENPIYFIFSDDIDWAKDNLKTNNQLIFVSGNSIPDYEEIIMMSKCKHNIIANSTFSWWGAWLNENPKKIIISPQKWFNVDTDTRDLIPDKWIKI
jgi:hypothetical protein